MTPALPPAKAWTRELGALEVEVPRLPMFIPVLVSIGTISPNPVFPDPYRSSITCWSNGSLRAAFGSNGSTEVFASKVNWFCWLLTPTISILLPVDVSIWDTLLESSGNLSHKKLSSLLLLPLLLLLFCPTTVELWAGSER